MTTPTRNFLRQRAAALVGQLTDPDAKDKMSAPVVAALREEYNDLKRAMLALESGGPYHTLWHEHCFMYDINPNHDARSLEALAPRK